MWGSIQWGQNQWGGSSTSVLPPDPNLTFTVSDDFSFTDAASVLLADVRVFGDAFNLFDSATCILVVYVEPILLSVSDRFLFSDGINFVLDAEDILLYQGDRFRQDDTVILAEPFTILKSDAFSFADDIAFFAPFQLVAGDTFFYYWADAIQMALDQVINAGDAFAFLDAASALNIITAKLISAGDGFAFTDSIILNGQQVLLLGDKLSLSDDIQAQLHTRLAKGDSFSLTDFIRIVRGSTGSVFSDVFDITDGITISMSSPLGVSVGDALALSDAATINIRGTVANYLRRRLNDVSI